MPNVYDFSMERELFEILNHQELSSTTCLQALDDQFTTQTRTGNSTDPALRRYLMLIELDPIVLAACNRGYEKVWLTIAQINDLDMTLYTLDRGKHTCGDEKIDIAILSYKDCPK